MIGLKGTRVDSRALLLSQRDKEATAKSRHLNLNKFDIMVAAAAVARTAKGGQEQNYLKRDSTISSATTRQVSSATNGLFLGSSCLYYYLLLVISIFLLLGHGALLLVDASSQQQQTASSTQPTQEQYPVSLATTSKLSPTVPTTTTTSPANKLNSSSQSLPTSLKFTLIAGKFWKFNIKANSLSSHKEGGELRLHKNVSLNNYIIDDDYWFQYNPQQQQLFAWPSLVVKPGTYYFVLLPSGTDIEADSENAVGLDVVANIVVELIRPLYQGLAAKNDIDLLIDHKFSLDYLHRLPSYPLLLNQIVSVLQFVSPKQQPSITTTTTVSPTTLATILQNKQVSANKLSEIILLNSTYSPDGDLFSLTWSSHPSLANNNTIVPITQCRLGTINETVTKLSGTTNQSLSSTISNIGEKLVISYPLSVPLLNNQQAIFPTDRGDHSLKLSLNGPCQLEKIVEKLTGSQVGQSLRHKNEAPSSDANIITSSNETQTLATSASGPQVVNVTLPPPAQILPTPEAIDSTSAASTVAPLDAAGKAVNTSLTPLAPSTTTLANTSVSTPSELPSSISSTNAASKLSEQTLPNLVATNETITPVKAPPVLGSEEASQRVVQPQQQPPTSNPPSKSPPQTKSFADLLDTSTVDNNLETKTINTTSSTTIMPRLLEAADSIGPPAYVDTSLNQTLTANQTKLNDIVIITDATASNISAINAVPTSSSTTKDMNQVSSESSLDEDLLGILNDVMEYFISYAIPISIVVGIILLVSIVIALVSLCMKRRKSKRFQVKNRFNFRYGSERRAFLKNSSKPVILDADQKSLSLSGTPQHRAQQAKKLSSKKADDSIETNNDTSYYPMHMFSYDGGSSSYTAPASGAGRGADVGGGEDGGEADCGGGGGFDCCSGCD